MQLLVTYDCPNEAATAILLRLALNDAGLTDTDVRITVVISPEQAEKLGFEGPPTILIDGEDPFAQSFPRQSALACRITARPTDHLVCPISSHYAKRSNASLTRREFRAFTASVLHFAAAH